MSEYLSESRAMKEKVLSELKEEKSNKDEFEKKYLEVKRVNEDL